MIDERRSRLLGVKLRALVAEHLGLDALEVEPSAFPSGAAFVHDGRAWVFVEGAAERSLGAALAWARRHDATELDLVAEQHTGMLARRAAGFRVSARIWFAQERTLLPAVPEPLPVPSPPPASHLELAGLIESGGATVVVEHGVVTGEVRGLEVCRVVDEPTVGRLMDEHGTPLTTGLEAVEADGPDGVVLEVGVGANDREAFRLLHGHLPKSEALAGVVDAVRRHRSADAPGHPLNRMAAERGLRADAIEDPGSIGLTELRAIEPPLPRPSMKEVAPCVAAGRTVDGVERIVVFSVGVDLELAPFIVDVIASCANGVQSAPPVRVVMPERDLVPAAQALLDLVDHSIEVDHPGTPTDPPPGSSTRS